MELITKGPKGTTDVFAPQVEQWQMLEAILSSEARLNGFSEVRTPLFEHTELFLRSVGDTTDVVEKQMYTFTDKGGRSISLRPEGTAGVARAMLEHGNYNSGYPLKYYYIASCYRYEKPQKGRLRELHQFGVELFGAAEPMADAQVISIAMSAIQRIGLKNVLLELNSIGCPDCRKTYHAALKDYFSQHLDKLCDTCKERLERNPMRILDCKSEICAKISEDAPYITDYICADCTEHFDGVKQALDAVGISYHENPRLVRGLDYYTRTVFEFISNEIGSQGAIGGGGRYDGLIEELGGKATPGLGFGLGLDRILLLMEAQEITVEPEKKCEVFIAAMGKQAQTMAFSLTDRLHKSGISADCELCGRGLKPQMKYADRVGAAYTIVLGDMELSSGKAALKAMKTGEEYPISLGEDFTDDYLSASVQAEDDISF